MADSNEISVGFNDNDNNVINIYMYVLVNNDVKMGKGKIAGQVGHVVGHITEAIVHNYFTNPTEKNVDAYHRYRQWIENGSAKVILKSTEEEMLQIIENSDKSECRYIRDAGRTQIAPNTLTVVGFYPNVQLKEQFQHLKLL